MLPTIELLHRNRRRIPWTLIRNAGILFADEYRERSFELLDSYFSTNTADAYSSCCIVIADEYRGRSFELLYRNR